MKIEYALEIADIVADMSRRYDHQPCSLEERALVALAAEVRRLNALLVDTLD